MLIPLLAAAVLGQMLGTMPLRLDAVFAVAAPFDPASLVVPLDEPEHRPVHHHVAQTAPDWTDQDRNDCFCGAN
jgi:hypothetical protein